MHTWVRPPSDAREADIDTAAPLRLRSGVTTSSRRPLCVPTWALRRFGAIERLRYCRSSASGTGADAIGVWGNWQPVWFWSS